MTPSIDLRIASMIRAMQDVIAPAVDPSNSLAREQSMLMIGQLQMIGAQWRLALRYASACLADLRLMADGLKVEGGSATQAAWTELRAALDGVEADSEVQYQSAARALEKLVRASDEDASPAFRMQLRTDALRFSQRQAERDRAWFAGSGFDMEADRLPSISSILAAAE